MIYLSKGIVQKNSTKQLLRISHCGQDFQLTGTEAALWLKGRFGFAVARGAAQEQNLQHLNELGIAERNRRTRQLQDTGL